MTVARKIGERLVEMRHRHFARVERLPQRDQAGAANHVLQIGARIALGLPGDRLQVDVRGKRHPLRLDLQDPLASCLL